MVLAYELGRALEPRATHHQPPPAGGSPLGHVLECPTALVHDRDRNCWWQVGDPSRGEDFRPMLEVETAPPLEPFPSQPLRPEPDDENYARLIQRTIEYVHAGDIFQANITRRFRSKVCLDSVEMQRRFATALLADSGALFGAVLDLGEHPGDRTVISLSPELFLELDPVDRSSRTRPIKGTLPGGSDPENLRRSGKDAAELAMIVDLMRNDLGRICDLGSVRVTEPRSIESHPDVIHGVAEVRGRLKSTVGFAELLGATFPAGSITGAPKIRAMQVIDELESGSRDLYCGAIGYASNCGRTALDVSIRTLDLRRVPDPEVPCTHEIVYGAGCGTVAESDPWSEVAESHAKAALLAAFLEKHDCSGVTMDHPSGQVRSP
jgi:para-aminobenzoate synthetase component 1